MLSKMAAHHSRQWDGRTKGGFHSSLNAFKSEYIRAGDRRNGSERLADCYPKPPAKVVNLSRGRQRMKKQQSPGLDVSSHGIIQF